MKTPTHCFTLNVVLAIANCSATYAAEVVFPGKDWQAESPEKHGLNLEKLANAADVVRQVTERYGFLVVKDGVLVHETYFTGDKDSKYRAFSATKGFGSALVGIAQTKGLLNVNDKVTDWLPYHHPDIVKDATIEHILTMTAGHSPPGSTYRYTSGPILNTLPSILWEATGMSPYAFYEKELAAPLGLTLTWPHTDKGWMQIGNQGPMPVLTTTHRDMARLGWLWLNKGNWNGKQLISKDYIEASIRPPFPEANAAYGYLWWLNPAAGSWVAAGGTNKVPAPRIKNAPANVYNAAGANAQLIYVIPDHNMVVVTMGNTTGSDATNRIWDAIQSALLTGSQAAR